MASNSCSRKTQKGDAGSDPKDNKAICQPSVNGLILMIDFFPLGEPWALDRICALVKAWATAVRRTTFLKGIVIKQLNSA